MLIVTEIRGLLFSVVLADNSTLTLQPSESQSIKDDLMSDSLKAAVAMKCVSIAETNEKKTSNKKNGGAVTNE